MEMKLNLMPVRLARYLRCIGVRGRQTRLCCSLPTGECGTQRAAAIVENVAGQHLLCLILPLLLSDIKKL